MSGNVLHAHEIHRIMLFLSTKDVLRCMRVCKHWKAALSDEYFWKRYVNRNFDLTVKSKLEEGQLYQWSDPDVWFCYFEDRETDPYVIRPFPSVWNCGVVVPFGLEPLSGDVKHLQGLCKSLEILVHMRQGIKSYGLKCGNECSSNEGSNAIDVVLFPWDGKELPDGETVLSKIFHFHPEICNGPITSEDVCKEKMFFHLEEDDHELTDNPCLNMVFGRSSYFLEHMAKNYDADKEKTFFNWLQNVMVPSRMIFAGEQVLNPIVDFFITNLAPGWVGGALTGQTWT